MALFCCYFLLSSFPTSHAKKHQDKSESKKQKMCLVFHLILERATGTSLLTLHGSDPLCWITRVKSNRFDSWLRWSFEQVMNLIPSPSLWTCLDFICSCSPLLRSMMLQKEERRLASEALSDVGVVKGAETKRNERESLRGVINRRRKQRKV